MNSRERIRAAFEQREPDRVPVWCQIGTDHVIRNGVPGAVPCRNADEYVDAACALTQRYRFDGFVCSLMAARKESDLSGWFAPVQHQPGGDPTHIFDEADPDSWDRDTSSWGVEDMYPLIRSRELLGPDIHLSGWTGDGFSKAIQWFPSIEDALIGMQMDPGRFEALVRYFDDWCINIGVAQIVHGGAESIQVSSAYAGSSFISRTHYEQIVVPSVRRVNEALKAAGTFTYLHTCGFINDRLELMAETGIDCIECMDPPPLGDTSLAEAKRRVGTKVALKGNLDSPHLLWQGTDEEVERTVRECFEAGMPGGGYILSTACSVAPMVAPTRMEKLVEYAERWGRYGN